jgi:hypothetical protein
MYNNDIEQNIEDGIYNNKLPYVNHKQNKTAFDAYHNEEYRVTQLFMVDMFLDAMGREVSPAVAKAVVNKAWEYGHSGGLQEVLSHYEVFMDVLKATSNPMIDDPYADPYAVAFREMVNQRVQELRQRKGDATTVHQTKA